MTTESSTRYLLSPWALAGLVSLGVGLAFAGALVILQRRHGRSAAMIVAAAVVVASFAVLVSILF